MSASREAAGLMVLVSAALGGCAASATAGASATSGPPSSSEALTASPHRLVLDDGTTVLVSGPWSGDVPTVLYTGRTTRLDGGCWGFDDGLTTGVLVLQHGTTRSPDGLGLVTPSGVTFHVGDAVEGGSGGGAVVDQGHLDQWQRELPDCFAGRSVAAVDVVRLSERSTG